VFKYTLLELVELKQTAQLHRFSNTATWAGHTTQILLKSHSLLLHVTVNMLQNAVLVSIINYYISEKNLLLIRRFYVQFVGYSLKISYTVIFITYDIHTQFVFMFTTFLHTEFNMPSPSGSLVITVKLKADDNFCMATILLFNILYRKNCTFFKYLLPRIIPGLPSKWH
jgi:hypothetical protein